MLKLPAIIRREFKGGWMDGEKYEQTATRENYEIKFLGVRDQAGGTLTTIYRLSDRRTEGKTEIQIFEFDQQLPHDAAKALLATKTAHARN